MQPANVSIVFQNIDWNMVSALATAASALATFIAVLVALHPIFAEKKRVKARAVNLRSRLLINLFIIKSGLDGLSILSVLNDCA